MFVYVCRLLPDATFDVIDSRSSHGEREGDVLKFRKGKAMNEQEPENAGTPHAPQDGLAVNVHDDVMLSERLKGKHYRGGSQKLFRATTLTVEVGVRRGRRWCVTTRMTATKRR